MQKSKKTETRVSVQIPLDDISLGIPGKIGIELRKVFGKSTMIGGSGAGFGNRDFSVYTPSEEGDKVKKFIEKYLKDVGYDQEDIDIITEEVFS